MSVKELVLKGNSTEFQIKIVGDKFLVRVNGQATLLDRNQADMLRLYLTEHLK